MAVKMENVVRRWGNFVGPNCSYRYCCGTVGVKT